MVDETNWIGKDFVVKFYDTLLGKPGAWPLERFYEESSGYSQLNGRLIREAPRADRRWNTLIEKLKTERLAIVVESVITVRARSGRYTVVAIGQMSRAGRVEADTFVHSTEMITPTPLSSSSVAGQQSYWIINTTFRFIDPRVDDDFFGTIIGFRSTNVARTCEKNAVADSSILKNRVVDEPSKNTARKENVRYCQNCKNIRNSRTPVEMVGSSWVSQNPLEEGQSNRMTNRLIPEKINYTSTTNNKKADLLVIPKSNSFEKPKQIYRPSNAHNTPKVIDKTEIRTTETRNPKYSIPPQDFNRWPNLLRAEPINNNKIISTTTKTLQTMRLENITDDLTKTGTIRENGAKDDIIELPQNIMNVAAVDSTNTSLCVPQIEHKNEIPQDELVNDQKQSPVPEETLKNVGKKLSKNMRKKLKKIGESYTETKETLPTKIKVDDKVEPKSQPIPTKQPTKCSKINDNIESKSKQMVEESIKITTKERASQKDSIGNVIRKSKNFEEIVVEKVLVKNAWDTPICFTKNETISKNTPNDKSVEIKSQIVPIPKPFVPNLQNFIVVGIKVELHEMSENNVESCKNVLDTKLKTSNQTKSTEKNIKFLSDGNNKTVQKQSDKKLVKTRLNDVQSFKSLKKLSRYATLSKTEKSIENDVAHTKSSRKHTEEFSAISDDKCITDSQKPGTAAADTDNWQTQQSREKKTSLCKKRETKKDESVAKRTGSTKQKFLSVSQSKGGSNAKPKTFDTKKKINNDLPTRSLIKRTSENMQSFASELKSAVQRNCNRPYIN